MQVVWLRATFFVASSSSPSRQHWHPCSTQSRWELRGARGKTPGHVEDVRRREKDEPRVLSLHSFAQHHSAADKSGLGELEEHGRESLSPGEGTPYPSHPALHPLPHPTSPFLLLRPPPNPSFSCLHPGWTGEGTRSQQWSRQRDWEPAKQQKKKKYLQRQQQLPMVSYPRCLIRCVLAARLETRVPGMGVVHQQRRRFSSHAKNASLTAQLSNPHQHFLMSVLSDCTAENTWL